MSENYKVEHKGLVLGPFTIEELLEKCEKGVFTADTKAWLEDSPSEILAMGDLIDFSGEPPPETPSAAPSRYKTAEEAVVAPGENFKCPYCRAVADLGDLLWVSMSPDLLDDAVLGPGEQKRFLPSQFTATGLAIDENGGVCTEVACPRCHMTLPRKLIETPQIVMSIIGAAGAGKSVFLASAIWQLRQMLRHMFGVGFSDLDPVANRWINAYEEKLFFQEDDTSLQQIAKTDLNDSNISRTVRLDGADVLLPLPSFFTLRAGEAVSSLVVYDSAGEHFRAGADTHSSAVTLNMLGADSLFFMFDPSADPRFRRMLDFGASGAHNYAQRQDILLAEMASRIKRHLGTIGGDRLEKPLIVGVSKADLLKSHLPMDEEIYVRRADGVWALNMDALENVSRKTESLLRNVTPEVVDTARDIARDVWFVPVSALGHNPMREGVRPCDIKPQWTELPVVITLALQGLVKAVGS